MLCCKYLCSKHFCESDFTTAEKIHLNRVAVPCVSDSTSHSVPEPSVPSLLTPHLDLLPSLLTPEDDLHDLPPTRTYSKRSLTSLTLTPTPVHAESPSTFSQISALQVSPASANTFAAGETSSTPGSVDVSASDGELGHIKCQSSSSKPRARHSLLKELNLASLPELTPRKRKLHDCIRKKESVLCKLKKMYKAKKLMKKLCCVGSDPLMENLSSSLTVQAARLLAAIVRNSRHKPKGRRSNFDDKVLALSVLKHSPKSYYILLRVLLPLPCRRTLQSNLNAVDFSTGINAHVFSTLKCSLQKVSGKKNLSLVQSRML
jgi:hypothetical protein